LVALGFLEADSDAYGALKLTESARAVLKGELTVSLREDAASSGKRQRRAKPASTGGEPHANVSPLLQALRDWRLQTAREHGVPAYVVFHDSTLESIAAAQPQNIEDLRGISGIGARKLERYADALLAITSRTQRV
jgi:ATP-dependent DNA helicase RecQ